MSKAKNPPAARECPYCLSHRLLGYPTGTKLFFLQGPDAGYTGIVERARAKVREHEILVRMEYEKRKGLLRIVSTERDRCLPKKMFRVPNWMPELSIEDNAVLHSSMLSDIRCLFLAEDRYELKKGISGLFGCVWWRRFPLAGTDLWPMLEAHGVQSHLKDDAIELLDFGLGLLRKIQGRAAIKKKRMPPMSQSRYQTERQRELRVRIFGHP